MSSFYSDASLVMIPSGYKNAKVYSAVPTDGTGDLTFTRASTATRVNASGLVEEVASGVPRLDYLNSTCPKLLLEPQRTNSEPNSNVFSVESAPTATVVKNQVDIFGNPNSAWLMSGANSSTDSSTANNVRVITSTPSQISCVSIYVKSPDGNPVTFNHRIAAVTKSTVVSGPDWVRVFEVSASALTSVRSIFYTSGGEPIIICQVQVEGGTFPTSLIPTLGASVTRVAELAQKTGISSLIGQTEGTIFAEINLAKLLGIQSRYILVISDNTANNRIYIAFSGSSSNILRARIFSAGVQQISIDTATISSLGKYKLALAYNNNDAVLYVNGVQIGTDTSVTIPACSQLNVCTNQAGASPFDDGINQTLLFKTRLTNSQLQELTTL